MKLKKIKKSRRVLLHHWFATALFTVGWIACLTKAWNLLENNSHLSIIDRFSNFAEYIKNFFLVLSRNFHNYILSPKIPIGEIDGLLIGTYILFAIAALLGIMLFVHTIIAYHRLRILNKIQGVNNSLQISANSAMLGLTVLFEIICWPVGFIINIMAAFRLSVLYHRLRNSGIGEKQDVVEKIANKAEGEEQQEEGEK